MRECIEESGHRRVIEERVEEENGQCLPEALVGSDGRLGYFLRVTWRTLPSLHNFQLPLYLLEHV